MLRLDQTLLSTLNEFLRIPSKSSVLNSVKMFCTEQTQFKLQQHIAKMSVSVPENLCS